MESKVIGQKIEKFVQQKISFDLENMDTIIDPVVLAVGRLL